ncbi:hypothetical protein H1C71_042566 [Ictidomys tridecemlineatus]|nr:hypothetical protein H1C71_042566 [Ictidomys tridecemlineatus]KAG3284249.1 hypothetical protein H1C71_042566 [Ictidomys tridecemlineatus]KAG3284250.1 hypothetical protein H1C71_042566 [Ictidomys tridecemlineatus]
MPSARLGPRLSVVAVPADLGCSERALWELQNEDPHSQQKELNWEARIYENLVQVGTGLCVEVEPPPCDPPGAWRVQAGLAGKCFAQPRGQQRHPSARAQTEIHLCLVLAVPANYLRACGCERWKRPPVHLPY